MRCLLPVCFAAMAWAHAPLTAVLRGPLRIDGARIVDANGTTATLRGAVLPDLDAATPATLGVMRVRWNFNAVRIPLSIAAWQRDGRAYLDRVSAAAARAGAADLVAILAPDGGGTIAFWTECAGALRDVPNAVFSAAGAAEPAAIVAAIRATGARQIVAVPALAEIGGENIIYEGRPSLAPGAASVFGSRLGRAAVYAGQWGLSECAGLPTDPRAVSDLLFQTLFDFDDRGVSWTAAAFAPGSLVEDTIDYAPTVLTSTWRCGQPGMGQAVLTWMTGDAGGFGVLRQDAIASAAGGPASPAAPGQLLALYIEQMGPSPDRFAAVDGAGRLPLELGGAEVFFDGQRAPILFAGQYQINVQAPRSLVPGRETVVQVVYRGIPSNRLRLPVVAAAPELFHDVSTKNVIALNEDTSRNSSANPAQAGSIVVVFATGTGLTTPPVTTGAPAPAPHPVLALPAALIIDGLRAETLFAGEVPGFVGLTQINARLPRQLRAGAAAVVVQVGEAVSQAPVVLPVR